MSTDTVCKIFVWVSKQIQEEIKSEQQFKNIAQRYLAQDKSGRKLKPDQIEIVKQGQEDDYFKTYFYSWK